MKRSLFDIRIHWPHTSAKPRVFESYKSATVHKKFSIAERIQDRLSSILVTFCTNQMRWFAVCHCFFKGVSDSSCPRTYQFVALFLAFPCFYACELFPLKISPTIAADCSALAESALLLANKMAL